MKVAIVHDYIKEYGGAERVLEALHEVFPDAPVYTTVYLPEFLGPHKERFKNWKIKTSFLQFLPLKSKLISPIRLVAPFVFKTFDFSKYDVVIVSATGAYSPNNISKNGTIQICYSHTPPRYLYGFATAREWKNNLIFRIIGELANHFLRLIDYKSSQNVDYFIANSENVRKRIQKFYKKDAVIIYPPIEISAEVVHENFRAHNAGNLNLKNKKAVGANVHSENFVISPRSYYLAGGRLARPKHIDLIVEAFSKLNLPLKIFGRGFAGYELELKSKAKLTPIKSGSKIEFLGEVGDEEKLELMKNAKAFIFASVDEDFGITPVEAMSVGTPVIAYRSGGVLESVVEENPSTGSGRQNPTGIFFDELSIESLSRAIKQFNNSKINPKDCIAQAQKFSKDRFKKEIKEFVEKTINR